MKNSSEKQFLVPRLNPAGIKEHATVSTKKINPKFIDMNQQEIQKMINSNTSPFKVNPGETNQEIMQKLTKKLKDLEFILKRKFENNFVSVRKAFLNLDADHDGYLRPEDFAEFFAKDDERINFGELKKLMMHKDSNKKGYLNYTDFSKWMGSSIQPSAGFYFRHDSSRNEQYEQNMTNIIDKNEKNTKIVRDKMTETKFMNSFVEKVQFQWKTLKKAFSDLNMAKSGSIVPNELRNYIKHWGYYLNDEQFQKLFDTLDHDKDGKISMDTTRMINLKKRFININSMMFNQLESFHTNEFIFLLGHVVSICQINDILPRFSE